MTPTVPTTRDLVAELARKAEAAGDQAELARWRRVLEAMDRRAP